MGELLCLATEKVDWHDRDIPHFTMKGLSTLSDTCLTCVLHFNNIQCSGLANLAFTTVEKELSSQCAPLSPSAVVMVLKYFLSTKSVLLDASLHLYNPLCMSVRRSVGRFVGKI